MIKSNFRLMGGGAEIMGAAKIEGLSWKRESELHRDGSGDNRSYVVVGYKEHEEVKITANMYPTGTRANMIKLQEQAASHAKNDLEAADSATDYEVIFFADEQFTSESGRYMLVGAKITELGIDGLERDNKADPVQLMMTLRPADGYWKGQ